MKLLSTLFILTATQFSTSVLATGTLDIYHVECESCVTESQFTQAAKDNAISRETVFMNVMNIQNYEIMKYRVYKNNKTVCDPNGREPDGEGGFIRDCWLEHTLTANKVTLTNTELNEFRDFADLQNDLESITLDPDKLQVQENRQYNSCQSSRKFDYRYGPIQTNSKSTLI